MTQPVWNTPAGYLGTYPASLYIETQLQAEAVIPAVSLTYKLLSGSLPAGLSLSNTGLIYGTPSLVENNKDSYFTIRITDNLANIKDRTFYVTITGSVAPKITTPTGSLMTILDSQWIDYKLTYNNPINDNPVLLEVKSGILPPGLEMDESGNIRGYAKPPVTQAQYPSISYPGSFIYTYSNNNTINVSNTSGFVVGRPIVFSTSIGNILANTTYFIKSIVSSTLFTISTTIDGDVMLMADASGSTDITLPEINYNQPIIKTFNFSVELISPLGNDYVSYQITVINQNASVIQGGPGLPPNSRIPAILNTRPLTFNLNNNDPYYGYYVLPPSDPSTTVFLGNYQSGNYFSFKILGYDFDNNPIKYSFSGLPLGLTGDVNTGWITGTPILPIENVVNYTFTVSVYKDKAVPIYSPTFNFSFNISKDVNPTISWNNDSNLGNIFNNAISTIEITANAQVDLSYRIISGSLPPSLTLASNGQIMGRVDYQPLDHLMQLGDTSVFNFTVEAYSTLYNNVTSTKEFSLTVVQEFAQPTDILYIKAAPSIQDRELLNSLLTDESLIPNNYLYRPDDIYFGKAKNITYEHAYGINASNLDEYLAAVDKNHYWRNLTLGNLKTAIARDSNGNIIYEVVYSEIIDDLVNANGISIPEEISWPRPINLFLGPWDSSSTYIFTSYEVVLDTNYFTSLTSGRATQLYPNSLNNMRQRVAQTLGQVNDYRIFPSWMTSQQLDGSTIGFVPAWVICYTKPGYSETIKQNILNNWPNTLNKINFTIDRFTVDKSSTFNYNNDVVPPSWNVLPSGTTPEHTLIQTSENINSKDFFVLYPRKTILPSKSQY